METLTYIKERRTPKMETMSVKGQDFFLLSLSKRFNGMATCGGEAGAQPPRASGLGVRPASGGPCGVELGAGQRCG